MRRFNSTPKGPPPPTSPYQTLTLAQTANRLGIGLQGRNNLLQCYCICHCYNEAKFGDTTSSVQRRYDLIRNVTQHTQNYQGTTTNAAVFFALKAIYLASICQSCDQKHTYDSTMCRTVFQWRERLLTSNYPITVKLDSALSTWLGEVKILSAILEIKLEHDLFDHLYVPCKGSALIRDRAKCKNDIPVHLIKSSIDDLKSRILSNSIDLEILILYKSFLCIDCYRMTGEEDFILKTWRQRLVDAREIVEAVERKELHDRVQEHFEATAQSRKAGPDMSQQKAPASGATEDSSNTQKKPLTRDYSMVPKPIYRFTNDELINEMRKRIGEGQDAELFGKLAQLVQETVFSMTSSGSGSGAAAETVSGGGSGGRDSVYYTGGAGAPGDF